MQKHPAWTIALFFNTLYFYYTLLVFNVTIIHSFLIAVQLIAHFRLHLIEVSYYNTVLNKKKNSVLLHITVEPINILLVKNILMFKLRNCFIYLLDVQENV